MFIRETAIRQHLEREKSLSKKLEGNRKAFFSLTFKTGQSDVFTPSRASW